MQAVTIFNKYKEANQTLTIEDVRGRVSLRDNENESMGRHIRVRHLSIDGFFDSLFENIAVAYSAELSQDKKQEIKTAITSILS